MRILGADPAEVAMSRVRGVSTSYHCPNAETVRQHLAGISRRLNRPDGLTPRQRDELRADQDLLLDRLLFLTETANAAEEPT